MAQKPSVLFVASECAHFVKAGGLGDVVAALPAALRELGHDARIVIPRYDVIGSAGLERHAMPLGVPLGDGEVWASVLETLLPGTDVPVYLLDHEGLFGRGYLYDPPGSIAPDNLVRFAFLSRGAIQLCRHLGWTPDVFHAHDWPSGLLPVYTNTLDAAPPIGRAATRPHDPQPGTPGEVPRERSRRPRTCPGANSAPTAWRTTAPSTR